MKSVWLAAFCVAGAMSTSANAQQSLTVIAYGGLFQERYTKSVIEPFEKAFPGIKVNYFGLPTSGQMLGTLRAQKASPQADVAILDITVSKVGTDESVFTQIDEASVPNIAELRPEARVPGVAGVGVTFDSFALVYNPELVKTPLKGLKDLASPELKGKVAFTGMPDIIGLSAIAVMDKQAGGPGLSRRFEKGYSFMASVAPNILTWEPQPEIYPVIIGGQAAAGLGWNARAVEREELKRKIESHSSRRGNDLPSQHHQFGQTRLLTPKPPRNLSIMRCRQKGKSASPKTCITRRPTPRCRSTSKRPQGPRSVRWAR